MGRRATTAAGLGAAVALLATGAGPAHATAPQRVYGTPVLDISADTLTMRCSFPGKPRVSFAAYDGSPIVGGGDAIYGEVLNFTDHPLLDVQCINKTRTYRLLNDQVGDGYFVPGTGPLFLTFEGAERAVTVTVVP